MVQNLKGRRHFVPTGRAGQRTEFIPFTDTIGARFVLFRMNSASKALTLCDDDVSRVETTFRIAFKGGLRLFLSMGVRMCVRSLHFDGHKHYGRRLDRHRILRDVESDGIEIPHDILIDDATSDHREEQCQPYDDCQLLQLTDVLVSGFRTVLGQATSEAHRQVCMPLAELADKWNRGRKGFSNSRWGTGFCISEGSIDEQGQWQFSHIEQVIEDKQGRLY
jgi:hypothetical protein